MGRSGLCALDRINLNISTERAQGHFLSPWSKQEWNPLHKITTPTGPAPERERGRWGTDGLGVVWLVVRANGYLILCLSRRSLLPERPSCTAPHTLFLFPPYCPVLPTANGATALLSEETKRRISSKQSCSEAFHPSPCCTALVQAFGSTSSRPS
jgi:hypothetical protein